MDPAAQKFLDEIWGVAITRRLKPVQTGGAPNTLGFCSVKVLKLDADSFVLTFSQGDQNHLMLWVMAVFCELDQDLWWNDATILLPEETAKDFVANNLNFIVPADDDLNYMKCMKTGMTMDLVDRSDKVLLFGSTDRVVAFLNRWIRFIGLYLGDLNKATDFLNLSLDIQQTAFGERTDLDDPQEHARAIEFHDNSQPLALIESGKPLPNLNTEILRGYLRMSQAARRKIVSHRPRHQALLQRDRALLKKLQKNR